MNSDELAKRIVRRLESAAPQNVELPALMIDGRAYGISELRAMPEADRAQWGGNVAKVINQFLQAVDRGHLALVLDFAEQPECEVIPLPQSDWWLIELVEREGYYGNGTLLGNVAPELFRQL